MPRVLVIAALQEELDAVFRLKPNGREDWVQRTTTGGYLSYEAEFEDNSGNPFEVIGSAQPGKGMVASAIHTTRMLSFYPYPDFVFMTGICAGRRKKGIVLGDVIVANMAFDYEVGKKTLDKFEPEMAANKPDARMVQWLNDFHSKNVELEEFIQIPRPPSLRFQKEWVLFKLYEKEQEGVEWPLTDQDFAEARTICPGWKQALSSLSKKDLIKQSHRLTLTGSGREEVVRLKTEGLTTEANPDQRTPTVRIGAFATGSQVVAVPNFFEELAQRERTVLALDMEATAFFQAVQEYSASIPCAVMKGVCDFADDEKDDAFHAYAAEAAARWMLAFVQFALPLMSPASSRERTQVINPEAGAPVTQAGFLYQNSVVALYLGRLCDTTLRPDNQRITKVRVETATGVDDVVVTYADGGTRYIQAKENVSDNESAWTKLWNDLEVQFSNPIFNTGTDRLLLYAGEARNEHDALIGLCEKAVHSAHDQWIARLTPDENQLLEKIKSILSPKLSSDPDLLVIFFRHIDIEIASLIKIERDIVPRWMPLSNEPPTKLFRLLRDRVGGATRYRGEFNQEELRLELALEDRITLDYQPNIEELLARVKQCGAVLRQHKHTFGNTEKHINRAIVGDISQWARAVDGDDNLAFLMDQAGMGKTIIARDVLLELEAAHVAVLAIKADQQLSGVITLEDIRINLHLPDSPERVVERLAERGRVVVLIDQIDALSLSMARDQKALNLVLDLVARLRLIPNVRIMMSCRTFDLNNDPRLKQLDIKKRFSIPELVMEEVKDVLERIGFSADSLSPTTQQLLRVPLNLNLFTLAMESQPATADTDRKVKGIGSLQDLYTLLWSNVVRKPVEGAPPIAQRERTIDLLTHYMNAEQRISAPQSVLTRTGDLDLEGAASWLASEGILIAGRTEWSFLHQTFFDYCYAKNFVEGGGSLSEMVLQGDQGLFARPQIIQVLTYLRDLRPQDYLRELNTLLTAQGLRAHLHDLIIRWFGALTNPTEDEWLITRQLLFDPLLRARLMAAMAGNPGWFQYLKDSTLPTMLGQETILDTVVIPYLISMLDVEQAAVIKMVRPYHGRSEQWNRRLRWMLETIRNWKTGDAIELFELEFSALSSADISHLYQLDDVARADPRAGCRLVKEAFNKALEEYVSMRRENNKPYLFSLSTHLEQFNGSTIDNALKELTHKEPEYFLDLMLPWVERVVELTPDREDSLPYFPSDEFSYLGWYGDSFVVKHELIEAYISALTSLASNDSTTFRKFAARLSALPRATPQRLLAHAFRAVPEMYTADAFEFLTGDKRRLDLGDHDQYDTRMLIRALYPHLTPFKRAELEDFILSYDYIRKYAGVDGLRWRGIEKLYLLQALPRQLLTERAERHLGELERKFPNVRASESPTTIRGGFVGSPIPDERARKMSDKAWLSAMAQYKGTVRHKHDFLKGGASELGGVLFDVTKENPERFYRLALQLPDDVDDSYVQAIMSGLAESAAPAYLLFEVIRHFAPHEWRDIKGIIARVVEKRVKDGVPDDIVDLIDGYLRGPSASDEDWWKRQEEENNRERYRDGLNDGPYISYLNSNRGASLRTLVRVLDEQDTQEAKTRKWELIEFVATDTSTALRAGAIEALLYMLHEDRARAVTTFERLLDGHPGLLRSHFTQEFLRYGLYRYYRMMKPFIVDLMNAEHELLQQRGAELACIAAISPQALDSEEERTDANKLADDALTGVAPWRRGAARVYATNITSESCTSCVNGLLQLLNDEDTEVRRFVNGVFHRLRDEDFIKLRDFISAFGASRALSKETHWFTEFLWQHGNLDPLFSLSVVKTMLRKSEESTAKDASLRFSGGEDLVRLVLGIYTSPLSDEELRKRAMDIFDQLMNVFTGQALMVLGEWDRR